MTTLSSNAAAQILDWVYNGSSTTAGQRWLALDTDGSATEVTSVSYSRYDLAAAMPTFTSGTGSSDATIAANVGTATATHYRIVTTSNSSTSATILTGALNLSKTGAFTIAAGDITGTIRGV
jgi:hypothetical protein